MRKRLFILLLICSVFLFSFMSGVNAAGGYGKAIRIVNGNGNPFIYNDGPGTEIEGATYDEESNTLTLNNFKEESELLIDNTGEDFKLKLVGDNEITNLIVESITEETTINIIGDGSLTINKNRSDISAPIRLIAAKMVVGENVTLKAYTASDEYFENHPDVARVSVYAVFYEETNDDEVVVIKGDNNGEVKKKTLARDIIVSIDGYSSIYDITPTEVTLAYDSQGRMHFVYFNGDKYIFFYATSIGKDADNNYYLINDSNEHVTSLQNYEHYHGHYNSMEEVKASYIVNDPADVVQITKVIDINDNHLRLRYDSDSKRYAVSGVYGDDSVYELTGDTIVLENGGKSTTFEKAVLITNDPPSEDDLISPTTPYYTYIVEGEVLVSEPKKEETKFSNPKTNDSIVSYVMLFGLSIATLYLLKNKKNA